MEFHVAKASTLGIESSALNHLLRHVDSDRPARWSNRFCGEEHVESSAGSKIEHDLSWLQTGQCRWIAARNAQVRLGWDASQLVRRIPEGLGDLLGRGLRAAHAALSQCSVPVFHDLLDFRVGSIRDVLVFLHWLPPPSSATGCRLQTP